jgi:hypothetical protein
MTPTLGLLSVVKDGFSLTPNLEEDVLVVEFAGNGDLEAVEALATFLKLVHREALHLKVKEVRVDLRQLYFMNSSCFKSFVTWIDAVARGVPETYGVRFLANPSFYWQRRSLEALRRLAAGVVSVDG